ncbi:MAG: peptide chain release factor 2 [Gemmataceae bacterium]|nr:peptide chain release factor 2 [Gemmataceae bacterium]
MNAETRRRVDDLISRLRFLRDSLDIRGKRVEREKLNEEQAAPNFWDNPEKAQKRIASFKAAAGTLKIYEDLERGLGDLEVLNDMAAEDPSMAAELEAELATKEKELDAFELRSMLSGQADGYNAFLRVQAGAGGAEACDWAQMLLRMYSRWAERNGYKVELLDEVRSEEAGLRSATIKIEGDNAYGYLQSETGVHRLVRISPFDSNARRQTSFAAVDVTPEIDDTISIDIKPDDLIRQTFRSGGPGGQHQNKTESGVRYIHVPTGVAAESRTERSQHKNDDNAYKMLKARLYKIEEMKRRAEVEKAYDDKGEVSWGNQIRNYVMQPYTMVKDNRTDEQTPQVNEVLDGDIDAFIQAYLRQKAAGKAMTAKAANDD